MCLKAYVTDYSMNLKQAIEADGFKFYKKMSNPNIFLHPFTCINYRYELVTYSLCNDIWVSFKQNLIGILYWIFELGIFEIGYEVLVLLYYFEQPITCRILLALYIFKYINTHKKNDLAFDPAHSNICEQNLIDSRIKDMNIMYPNAQE